jgi:hypothetical protein
LEAQNEVREKGEGIPKPTPAQARWLRVEGLRGLGAGGLHGAVRAALAEEWKHGRKPERILFRRGYARLGKALEGPYSDRKLPPAKLRPPTTRLISPKGTALELHLTTLYVAQCTTAPGKKPSRSRLVLPRQGDRSGLVPWADLVAAPATVKKVKGRRTHVRVEDNRVRQIASTLGRLAGDDVGLLEFPNAAEAKGKFEGFRMLDETGNLLRASRIHYTVPKVGEEELFALPPEFFANGWHLALTDSEMAMILALCARREVPAPWEPGDTTYIEGPNRIRRYGLSPAAYSTHKYLEAFGVLEVIPAVGRREDGTFDEYGEGVTPIPHRFRVREEGFSKEAVSLVMATLTGMGLTNPDGA